MNTKKLNLLLVILLTLILIGAGCDRSDQVVPAEDLSVDSADVSQDDLSVDSGPNGDDDFLADSGPDGDDDEVGEFESWKTYEQDGITLKYPENWRVAEDGGLYRWYEGIDEDFVSQNHFEHIIRISEISIGIIVQDNAEVDDVDNLVKYVDYHETLERTYVDGHGALLVTCGGINYMECLLLNNKEDSVIIVISYMFTDDSDSAGIEKEVNQILQTVRLP